MANQEIWDAANRRNAQDMVKYSWVLLGSGMCTWLFDISYAIIIHLVVMLVGLGIAIYSTVRYLNQHFDTYGNRKE